MIYRIISYFFWTVFLSVQTLLSQDIPVSNVTTLNNPEPGYIVLAPYSRTHVCLLDNTGVPAYMKETGFNNLINNAQVQSNGMLSFFNENAGGFIIMDKEFNTIDTIKCIGYMTDFHHFEILPNGNYMLLGVDIRRVDMSVLINGGNPNASVTGFVIQEIDKDKNLVFEWNTFDHFNITDATEDIDLRRTSIRYTHCNKVEVCLDGNLLLSSRYLDEITKINRQTGAIIWRMGGSKCKNNQFVFVNDTIDGFFGFSHMHDCVILSNGDLLLFDNGNLRTSPFSRAVQYRVDERNKTVTKVWEYRHTPDVYSEAMGGVQRFDNGSTMISWGSNSSGLVATEIKLDNTVSFEIQSSAYSTYMATRKIFRMDAVKQNIRGTGNISFNDNNNTTGISLNISTFGTEYELWIEKHGYTARNISFSSSAPCEFYPMRWVVSNFRANGTISEIKFNLSQISNIEYSDGLLLYYREREGSGSFRPLQTSYNAQTSTISAGFPGYGEFIICSRDYNLPVLLTPSNNQDGVAVDDKLTWNKLDDNEQYDVLAATDSNFINVIIQESNLDDNFYDYTELLHYTRYYWKVRARNGSCLSAWSSVRSFRTIISNPNLISPINQSGDAPITGELKWNAVPGAESYSIEISLTPDFKELILSRNNIEELYCPFTLTGYNTRYYWHVRAHTSSYNSNWSGTWYFTTKLYLTELISPKNDTLGVNTSLNLRWNHLNGAELYIVQVSKGKEFTYLLLDTTILIHELNFKKLDYNTKYYWRVRGKSMLSNGSWSEIWSFTTNLKPPDCDFPTDGMNNSPLNGLIAWTPVDSALIYHFQLSQDSLFTSLIDDKPGLKHYSVQFKNLLPETRYFWRAKASNYKMTSEWSEIFSFSTRLSSALDPPVLNLPLNNSLNEKTEVLLDWNKVDKSETFRIQLSLAKNFAELALDTAISDTFFILINLNYNTRYYWRIQSMNTKQNSGWSQVRNFTTLLEKPALVFPVNNSQNISVDGKLIWTYYPDASSYYLQISRTTDFAYIEFEDDFLTTNEAYYRELKPDVLYFWRVKALSGYKESEWSEVWSFRTTPVSGVQNEIEVREENFASYPNPFSNSTDFEFVVSKESFVSLKILTIYGNEIADLISKNLQPGKYQFKWVPGAISDGVYIYSFNAGNYFKTGNLLLIR